MCCVSHILYFLSANCSVVSGGFATVHPNNKLTVNVVEAAPLDAFSAEVSLVQYLAYVLYTHGIPFHVGCSRKLAGGFEGGQRKRLGAGQVGGTD